MKAKVRVYIRTISMLTTVGWSVPFKLGLKKAK